MNYEAISLVLERPLARLILKRPETGNEADSRLLKELSDAAERLRDEPEVTALLLEGEGPDFCRGWAADVLAAPPDSDPFGPIASLALPVIVALQGEAAGAGLE